MNLFSTNGTDITTPEEHPELQELSEKVATFRQDIRGLLQEAREHERKAHEAEGEATGGGDVALVGQAVDHERKADALREEAKELSAELKQVVEHRDRLAEEVDEEVQEKVDTLYAEALREAADATEQAVEAHRRLREIEVEYSDYISRGARHPDAKHWLYRGEQHGSGGVQWIQWAREIAAEKE